MLIIPELFHPLTQKCFNVSNEFSNNNCFIFTGYSKYHKYPEIEDFSVTGKGYRNNTFKRKVAESLLIKNVRPTLEMCVTKVI